jgi:hypothetical protein
MPGISVPFQEHEDSPSESGNRDGEFKFVRVFLTDYANRWTFVRELFTGGFVGLPMAYSSDFPGVFADTFNIERIANNPIGATITNPATQVLSHNTVAKITVTYAAMTPAENGTLITYEQQEAGEFITVPSRGLKWYSDNDPLPADYHAAYPASTTRHVITWSQVRQVPWQTLATMMNKVNSVAFLVPVTGQVFVAGTLIFAERSASITLNTSGLTTWRIGLTFLEKAQTHWNTTGQGPIGGTTVYGWNYQWREDTGTFDKPVNAQTGAETFQAADLTTIFTSTV